MAESDDLQVQRSSLLGLLRSHVTLVLTLIPILLSGLRIFAVANGDRSTLSNGGLGATTTSRWALPCC